MDKAKVECLSCKKRYFVHDEEVPTDAMQGEAFPISNGCPFCESKGYAVLAEETK
jgi:Zn finger protein HypA/HybF involved in hydrogenase expression